MSVSKPSGAGEELVSQIRKWSEFTSKNLSVLVDEFEAVLGLLQFYESAAHKILFAAGGSFEIPSEIIKDFESNLEKNFTEFNVSMYPQEDGSLKIWRVAKEDEQPKSES